MAENRKKGIVKRGGWEIAKKILKAIPIIGTCFCRWLCRPRYQEEGIVAGAVHVGLDATPVVGTAKNVVEIFTGDWIPDKTPKPQTNPTTHPVQPFSNSKREPVNREPDSSINRRAFGEWLRRFVGVRQFEEGRFRPVSTEQLKSDRQARTRKPTRNTQSRNARQVRCHRIDVVQIHRQGVVHLFAD